MLKPELAQRLLAQNPHLYQRQAEGVIDAMLGEIVAAMARGDRIELRGFGAFTVKQVSARMGRNPKNGVAVPIDQKNLPRFRVGKGLRERLNKPPQGL